MHDLKPGDAAPDFTLPADGGGTVALAAFRGRKLVLYFYPKDDTPGCTTESCDFRDNMAEFAHLNAAIVGVSKDSVARHDKFKTKYGLNFPLASDTGGAVCAAYGVWKEKSMMGKKYMGIERTTFLIGEDGKILNIWRGVKVAGHAGEVKAALKRV